MSDFDMWKQRIDKFLDQFTWSSKDGEVFDVKMKETKKKPEPVKAEKPSKPAYKDIIEKAFLEPIIEKELKPIYEKEFGTMNKNETKETTKTVGDLKLSPPWWIYFRELKELFCHDPDISKIEFNDDDFCLKIYVNDARKAEALTDLLPMEKHFGSVVVKTMVIPANIEMKQVPAELLKAAFKDNPICEDIKTIKDAMGRDITFVVFKKEVVQYFNDNPYDLYGVKSTLYQDIADRIFVQEGGAVGHKDVFFCTHD